MSEHTAVHAHGDEHAAADHGHHNDPESIHREKRRYLIIFGILAVLTIVTVAVSKLHLPMWETIALGLSIALVKGSLVAAFFMHLISERKLVIAVLILTAFFFGVLMWGPWHHRYDAKDTWPNYDHTSKADAASSKPDPGHGH